jgi:hypothetical protein
MRTHDPKIASAARPSPPRRGGEGRAADAWIPDGFESLKPDVNVGPNRLREKAR